jgi:hypothetical protein
MNNKKKILNKKFSQNGVILLKSVFKKDEIDYLRDEAQKNKLKNDFLKISSAGAMIGSRILEKLKEIFEENYYYIGESHSNYGDTSTARTWHIDLRGDQKFYNYKTSFPSIVRSMLYLQDHKNNSYGTKFLTGSHKKTFYKIWSLKEVYEVLRQNITIYKNRNFNFFSLSNFLPTTFFSAINLGAEAGDVGIWTLRTYHSGNFLRIKNFESVCLPVFIEKIIEKNFKNIIKNDNKERAIIASTYGTNSKASKSYIDARIKKGYVPTFYRNSILDFRDKHILEKTFDDF